jgi:hypothetical protein
MLLLLATLALALGGCPKYSCESVDKGVCAEYDEVSKSEVLFSSSLCPKGTGCALLDLVNLEVRKEAVCIARSYDGNAMTASECLQKREGEDLRYGSHPKLCTTVDDCEIKNGNHSACLCGLNGKSYCQPELGSSLFDFYWKDCEANNNTVSRGELQVMANMLYAYYVYTISPPNCMINSIFEIKLIGELAQQLAVNGTELIMEFDIGDINNTTTLYDPDPSTDIDTSTTQDEDSSCGVVLLGAFALLLA